MRKSQKREQVFRGEITVFLALIFVLMMSLVGALIESASIQVTKNRKRADVLLGLESMFAEYDRKLLEEYDLFARHGCDQELLQGRLEYYGAVNMNHSVLRQELLTDNKAVSFYEQAVRYAKEWIGIEESAPETEYEFYSESYLEEEELVQMELEELLEREEAQLPEENNPIISVQNLKNRGLLTLICEHPEALSDRCVTVEGLPSRRNLGKGNWGDADGVKATDKVFFTTYLAEHFSDFTDGEEEQVLLYEQEYLLSGCVSDEENLEKACKLILSIRMAANYGYLLTDTVKQAEAEAMALTLCSILTVPGITEIVKHAILLAWAYGEGIVDMRVLMKGRNVPAVKTSETWQLQLANLVKLGTEEEAVEELQNMSGVSYQQYLTALLLMGNRENICMRSLDLIESNLQIKTDEYTTKIEIESQTVLRRGVKDAFKTTFGYQ